MNSLKLLSEQKLADFTQRIIKKYAISPNKNLGQNFAINYDIITKILEFGNINNNDVIIEIGGGIGTLTYYLLEKGCSVYFYEIDPLLVSIVKKEFHQFSDNLHIIEGDVLKYNFPSHSKILGNIPYLISSPLLFKIFKLDPLPQSILFLMQKEFADHLTAKPNTKAYSRLSVISSFYYDFSTLSNYTQEDFFPQPKVQSTLIRGLSLLPPSIIRSDDFIIFLRGIFNRKHKKIANNLKILLRDQYGFKKDEIREIILSMDDLNRRTVEFMPSEIITLYQEFTNKKERKK